MKKQDGFGNFGIALLAGLVATACGPVAPSVSKLSNTAGQKTSPTDGAAPDSALGVPGAGSTASARSATDANPQITHAQAYVQYKRNWSALHDARPSMELDKTALEDLVSTGTASFASSADRVKGQEAGLAISKTIIYVALNGDQATIVSRHLDTLKLLLRWRPAALTNPAPHWELSLVPPNTGDAVKDLNDLRQVKDALRDLVVDIGIEFQAD